MLGGHRFGRARARKLYETTTVAPSSTLVACPGTSAHDVAGGMFGPIGTSYPARDRPPCCPHGAMSDNPHAQPDTRPDRGGDALPTTGAASRAAQLSTTKVLAGGMAAATSAVLGSHFGASGTVGGAAVGSVITTIGTNLYQRSLERARDRVARQLPLPSALTSRGAPTTFVTTTDEQEPTVAESASPAVRAPFPVGRWLRVSLVGALLAFGLSLGLVTGIEWATGSPLSGGAGTTSLGQVLAPAPVDPPNTPPPRQPDTSVPQTPVPTPSPAPSPSSGPEHSPTSAKQHPKSTYTVPTPPVTITPSAPLPLPSAPLPRGSGYPAAEERAWPGGSELS